MIYDDEGSGKIENRKQKRNLTVKQEHALNDNELKNLTDVRDMKSLKRSKEDENIKKTLFL